MELTINNITKQYGNVTVLDDVSYRFTPGIYGILGANGAGKTTLFRIICGLMRANCGNIQYDHKFYDVYRFIERLKWENSKKEMFRFIDSGWLR